MNQRELERFIAKTKYNEDNGCVEWVAGGCHGYGSFRIQKDGQWKQCRVHRVIWEHFFGGIPEGNVICHKCDNTKCVRIDHLYLGTMKNNMDDKYNRERANHAVGERHASAKITEADVHEIRRVAAGGHRGTISALGRQYGLTFSAVKKIVERKSWKHV